MDSLNQDNLIANLLDEVKALDALIENVKDEELSSYYYGWKHGLRTIIDNWQN